MNIKLYCVGLMVLALSCTKDIIPIEGIDFDSSAAIPFDVVVYGGILTQRGKQLVMLSTPGRWPTKGSNTPISHASVTVSDGESTFHFEESDNPGFYYSVDSIQGEVGKAYTLTVTIGDKKYMARDTLVKCRIEDCLFPDIMFVKHQGSIMGFYSYNHNFGYSIPMRMKAVNAYHWEEEESDTLTVEQIIRRNDYDIMLQTGSPPNGVFSSEKYLQAIWGKPESIFSFYYLSISPQYNQFLVDYYSMTDWSTGLFSSQPGNIRTNFSSGASGFFFASDVRIVRHSVDDLLAFGSKGAPP